MPKPEAEGDKMEMSRQSLELLRTICFAYQMAHMLPSERCGKLLSSFAGSEMAPLEHYLLEPYRAHSDIFLLTFHIQLTTAIAHGNLAKP